MMKSSFLKNTYMDADKLFQYMNNFTNHEATVLVNNDNYFIMDWAEEDTTEYSIRYVLDKKSGTLSLYGDLGDATVKWYGPQTCEDIVRYMNDVTYFASKITTSTDLWERTEENLEKDLDSIRGWHLGSGESWTEFEKFKFEMMTHSGIEISLFPYGFKPESRAFVENHDISFDEVRRAGRRISGRVYLWALGFQMGMESLKNKNLLKEVS